MNKRILLMGAAVTVGGVAATIGTGGVIHAASMNGTAKLGLHKMHIREDAKLNQAVKDGVITEAQKTAFLAEVKSLHEANKPTTKTTMTKEQRQTAHEAFKTQIEAWAKTNNFPLSKIFTKLAS